MEDLLKSALRFSWAMTLFGTKQMGETMLSLGAALPGGTAVAAFEQVARAAEAQLGERWRETFRTGDRWQRRAVDLGFELATPPSWLTRGVLDAMLAGLERSAALASEGLPPGRGDWLELRNKLQAFEIFRNARTRLGLERASAKPLGEQVAAARDRDAWVAVWALEGLGYARAEDVWSSNRFPEQLLTTAELDTLPDWSLLPLHTGMGLSLAARTLAAAQPAGDAEQLGRALGHLADLCAGNARRGFVEASFEAVGLIARNLYPHTLEALDRELQARWPERRATFWHGVGRGLYFTPTQAFPGSLWRGVERTRREPPDRSAKLNALSGLVWAATLVNLREPEVLADFLDRRGDALDSDERAAFADGVGAACVIWRDCAPGDGHLEAFCHYRPAGAVEGWRRLVVEPSAAALARHGELRRDARIDELFAYRPKEVPA